jgi:hypothetical protein
MKLANATNTNRKFGKPNFLPRCLDTHPRVRFSVGENRMKLANATNTNRKFGKPRDLQFPFPSHQGPRVAPLGLPSRVI